MANRVFFIASTFGVNDELKNILDISTTRFLAQHEVHVLRAVRKAMNSLNSSGPQKRIKNCPDGPDGKNGDPCWVHAATSWLTRSSSSGGRVENVLAIFCAN